MLKVTTRTIIVLLLLIPALLSGCQSVTHRPAVDTPHPLSTNDPVIQALYQQHRSWQGTPYRLGGMSRAGVDCSAFVSLTFSSKFHISLPRTTADQHYLGTTVARNALRPGDLVFFRTEEKVRHVGIFVERGLFLHASTSRGVMLSRLDNRYWSSRYWKAKRLPENLYPQQLAAE